VETEAAKSKTLRIGITGSSGLVGTSLREHLVARGHEFVRLVRRQPRGDDEIYWSPERSEIDAAGLEGVDAVVHLAGENIFGRWTKTKKEKIRESRRRGTELLSRTLAELVNKPAVFICASAVGYYGDTGDKTVDESSPPQGGFLSEVCRIWEDATTAATQAGIRTVRLRQGIVLSSRGGALEMMRRPFRLGLGGRIGSGHQYMSWIHIEDVVRVMQFAMRSDTISGPVNAVSPQPVTNREFTKTLGRVLHRPTFLCVPGFAAKMALGEMAEEMLLSGQRVVPRKLEERGFDFRYPELSQALRRELDVPNACATSACCHGKP
jgi:uncharacterized protein (TIGR01777 family)